MYSSALPRANACSEILSIWIVPKEISLCVRFESIACGGFFAEEGWFLGPEEQGRLQLGVCASSACSLFPTAIWIVESDATSDSSFEIGESHHEVAVINFGYRRSARIGQVYRAQD